MVVCYAATRNLYPYVPMAIGSLLEHNPNSKVYFFCEDDEIEFIKDERIIVKNIYNYPQYIKETSPNYNTYFTPMSMLRCYLSKIITEDRILWLDIDTIVMSNIEDIWNGFPEYKYVGGVMENQQPPKNAAVTGRPYINSGVLLMNLEKIREDGIDDEMIDLLNTTQFIYCDQDAINIRCSGRIEYLDPPYNYSPSTLTTKQPPRIYHMTFRKLWDDPSVQLWNRYYKTSI